jgi:hypothetical protein
MKYMKAYSGLTAAVAVVVAEADIDCIAVVVG